ncbi:hypothetical protein ACSBR2_033103 [Camellia fascicularis]
MYVQMWMTKFPQRYVIVVLTFICTCVCYIERVGFSIAYTIAADAAGVPGGWIAQKIGGRRVLLLSFVLWSLTCALVPPDPNRVIILVMACLLVGVAQGFIFLSIHTVLAQWIPPHERSRSVSCTTSGMYLGAALGMLVLPILVKFWGAQSVFHVESTLGAMWSLLWFKFATDPPRAEHPKELLLVLGKLHCQSEVIPSEVPKSRGRGLSSACRFGQLS